MRDHIQQTYKESEVDRLHEMLHGEWVTFEVVDYVFMIVVRAAPSNGTEYRFILVKTTGEMADQMGLNPLGYMLAMEPSYHMWGRTMSVVDPRNSHPSYIMEKMGMNLSDAVAMSLILDRVGEEIGT
jgi:hypothetical protein